MRVGVLCERSGVVRDAFLERGHDAISCDLEPTVEPGPHIQGDCMSQDWSGFDLLICHPDCTYLAVSGLHWNKRRPERQEKTEEALRFVQSMMDIDVPRMALENPIGCISTRIRKPDQIIQPWQFGEDASKATCLWLKNLPLLQATNILPGGKEARRANQTANGQNKLGPSPERKYLRAKTYRGIALAMAEQWGGPPAGDPPCWEQCECCEDFICNIHETHAYDCECPSVDEWVLRWNTDPYTCTVSEWRRLLES